MSNERGLYIGHSKQISFKDLFIKLTNLMLHFYMSVTYYVEHGRLVGSFKLLQRDSNLQPLSS